MHMCNCALSTLSYWVVALICNYLKIVGYIFESSNLKNSFVVKSLTKLAFKLSHLSAF